MNATYSGGKSMMIKNRHTGEPLLEVKTLIGANLRGADLRGAIVDDETLKKNPLHIPCGLRYIALITDGYMRLGCKRHTHSEWEGFNDDEIRAMDVNALEFWKVWKAPLLAMCKAHAEECAKEES